MKLFKQLFHKGLLNTLLLQRRVKSIHVLGQKENKLLLEGGRELYPLVLELSMHLWGARRQYDGHHVV